MQSLGESVAGQHSRRNEKKREEKTGVARGGTEPTSIHLSLTRGRAFTSNPLLPPIRPLPSDPFTNIEAEALELLLVRNVDRNGLIYERYGVGISGHFLHELSSQIVVEGSNGSSNELDIDK